MNVKRTCVQAPCRGSVYEALVPGHNLHGAGRASELLAKKQIVSPAGNRTRGNPVASWLVSYTLTERRLLVLF